MSDIDELNRAVGRIEGKIDLFIEQMKVQDDRLVEQMVIRDRHLVDLESRVRTTEGRLHWYSGAAAMFGGIIAYITKGHT